MTNFFNAKIISVKPNTNKKWTNNMRLTCWLGLARVFGNQHVGLSNEKHGQSNTKQPNANGFAFGWNIGSTRIPHEGLNFQKSRQLEVFAWRLEGCPFLFCYFDKYEGKCNSNI